MNHYLAIMLVLVLVINLAILGTSRMSNLIRLAAIQGVAISVITVLAHADELSGEAWVIAGLNFAVMGVLAPWLLRRAMRAAQVEEIVDTYLGYVLSMALGLVMFAFSFWLYLNMGAVAYSKVSQLLPYAMTSVLCGLYLITFRRRAITQVIGYLVLANGVTLFGIGLASEQPLLVEMGILIDAFFALLVMGIAIHHISQEFDSIDVSRLDSLKDEI